MATPLLELDGVSKRFGQVVIATDLSLAIGPGDTVGIYAPSDCAIAIWPSLPWWCAAGRIRLL